MWYNYVCQNERISVPKTNTIKAGYRITCVSWENDADHYRTIVKEGFSLEETKLIAEIASAMMNRESGLENNYEASARALAKGNKFFLKIFEKYKHLFDEHDMDLYREDHYAIVEYITDNLTGYSVEGYALRVLDSIVIEHIPQDIVIEDVTDLFIE